MTFDTQNIIYTGQKDAQLLDALPIAICIINSDYQITASNRTFRKKFSVINTNTTCYKVLHGNKQHTPCSSCLQQHVLLSKKEQSQETTIIHDGTPHYYKITASPITDKQHGTSILTVIEDITEHVSIENKLAEYNVILEQKADQRYIALEHHEKCMTAMINAFHCIGMAEDSDQLISETIASFLTYNTKGVFFSNIDHDDASITKTVVQPAVFNQLIASVYKSEFAHYQSMKLAFSNAFENPFIIAAKKRSFIIYNDHNDLIHFFTALFPEAKQHLHLQAAEILKNMSILVIPLKMQHVVEGVVALFLAKDILLEHFNTFRYIANYAALSLNRQKYAARLLRSEKKYRDLIEKSRDMFLLCDKTGAILFANATFFKLTGYPSLKYTPKTIQNIINPDYIHAIQKIFIQPELYFASPIEIPFICADEKELWCDVTISPMLDKHQNFQISAREITKRKMLEKQSIELNTRLHEAQKITIVSLVKLTEYRDIETGSHLERIMHYTELIARQLAKTDTYKEYITEVYIHDLVNSCLLHDIGKVGIPDHILKKPARLTKQEFEIMKRHTIFGGDALKNAEQKINDRSYLNLGKEIAYYHHERWDGTGYPHGLKGEEIPLSARIVAVADVYDALISKRPYKKAFSHETALEIIVKDAGTHFDATIVQAFLQSISEENFPNIDLR